MTSLGWEDDGAQEGLMLRRSVGKCLTEAEMEDYLANRLSGVTREVIEEHLLVCAKCLDSVEQEEEFAGVFRSAAMQVEAEEMEKSFSGEEPGTGKRRARLSQRVLLLPSRKAGGRECGTGSGAGKTGGLVAADRISGGLRVSGEVGLAVRVARGGGRMPLKENEWC